jgi:predicted DNA-binding transcriptional regulator AlpA
MSRPTLDEVRTWPATVSLPKACSALRISRSHGYELAKTGEFPAKLLPVRGVRNVVTASLIRLLEIADDQTTDGGDR